MEGVWNNTHVQHLQRDEEARRLITRPVDDLPLDFTSDGRHMIFGEYGEGATGGWGILSLDLETGQIEPLVQTQHTERGWRPLSPDEQWILFDSDRSGRPEVYVRPFPDVDRIEHQITIGETTFRLDEPFFVLATQNPIEQEGTYPLPEAQVDRFMLKVVMDYPNREEEVKIMRQNIAKEFPVAQRVLSPKDIMKARATVKDVYMDEKIENYIIDIDFATRRPAESKLEKFRELIRYGGSPRSTIYLAMASKALAFVKRRGYVIPEDVRAVCHEVLRHRIGLTYEAEAENITSDEIITEILNTVEVP